MTDPPREDAIEAVRACQRTDIVVKMVTGDYAATASAIGQSISATVAVTTIILFQILYLLICRSLTEGIWRIACSAIAGSTSGSP